MEGEGGTEEEGVGERGVGTERGEMDGGKWGLG